METLNLNKIIKRIYDSNRKTFTVKLLRDLLDNPKSSSFFSWLHRLVKNKVLIKVERGKYILVEAEIETFRLANFIYSPSYVSLESALNFYGVLSQFPVEQTSVTVKKSKQKFFRNKLFSYSRIKKELFWGYRKEGDFLIALAEKALLDQVYLISKGLKRLSFNELEWSRLNTKRLMNFSNRYSLEVKKIINKAVEGQGL